LGIDIKYKMTYPQWLISILDDELYYALTLILMCAMSFDIGLVIGAIICM